MTMEIVGTSQTKPRQHEHSNIEEPPREAGCRDHTQHHEMRRREALLHGSHRV